VEAAVADRDVGVLDGLDVAEPLGDAMGLEERARDMLVRFEERRQRLDYDASSRHGGFLDHLRTEGCENALRDADKTSRREHDEPDEEQAEIEKPARCPDG
jgi:hypothetical protein